MFLEVQNKEHLKLLGLKKAVFVFEVISWGSQRGLFSFYEELSDACSYWLENTYKADKYSKTTTAEQLPENITGDKYAYHSYIPPTPKTISINIY